MQKFTEQYGPWALVTGASTGIGEEFAYQLAARGMHIILVARDKDNLTKVAQRIMEKYDVKTKIIVCDLSKGNFLDEIIPVTIPCEVGLLVNNAGFALTGNFLEHTLDDELSLLQVNCRAPIMLAHVFGQKMLTRGHGGIINVASAAGFLPLPLWTNYAASKSYLLSFSEGLWYELREKGIDVLALCPGNTKTQFGARAGTKSLGMNPVDVVRCALNSLGKKPTVVVGLMNKMNIFLLRIIPRRVRIAIGAKVVRGMM